MQELVYAALVPHPPVLIPAVGGEESDQARATREAMVRLCREVQALHPDVVVIISPHGPVFRDAVAVEMRPSVSGDLGAFGAPGLRLEAPVAQELAELMASAVRTAGVEVAPVTAETAPEWGAEKLDHGVLVPLQFLREAGVKCPVLPLQMAMIPRHRLYAAGQAMQAAIGAYGRRAAVLASGDLSHKLTPDAPGGFEPTAAEFDRQVVEALGAGRLERLFHLEHDLCERAGECGFRPLLMLAGVLDGLGARPRTLSYEAPFGVGYAVVALDPQGPDPARRLLPGVEAARLAQMAERRAQEHPLVQLARMAVEHYVRDGLELDFSAGAPHDGTALPLLAELHGLPDRAGVFVCLKVDGMLRGCMGSVQPSRPSLALETAQSAVDAAVHDSRFPPVEPEELGELEYQVDLLSDLEPVASPAELDPKRYGVVVVKEEASGVLLPDLEGIDTVADQIAVACEKASLDPDQAGLQVFRFTVRRFR